MTKTAAVPDTGEKVTCMFDYHAAARAAKIAPAVVRKLEKQAREEFSNDPMLMELHMIRAIKAAVDGKKRRTLR